MAKCVHVCWICRVSWLSVLCGLVCVLDMPCFMVECVCWIFVFVG
jgi:hypothetical protein